MTLEQQIAATKAKTELKRKRWKTQVKKKQWEGEMKTVADVAKRKT